LATELETELETLSPMNRGSAKLLRKLLQAACLIARGGRLQNSLGTHT
jgi:hypothetical protein